MSERFTASHGNLAFLQKSLNPPIKNNFGGSQSTFRRSGLMGQQDRSATLKKLESLRAVAQHAQEAELSAAIRMWLAAIDEWRSTNATPRAAAQQLSPARKAKDVIDDVAGPASALVRQAQAAHAKRKLRLLDSLRLVLQQGEVADAANALHHAFDA